MVELPEIITLEEFGGVFKSFYEEVYKIFFSDFVRTRPNYRGTRLGLKKHPMIDNKEYTFYHFTHDGDIETERIPNLRRMERISWPNPIINNSENESLKVWRNQRGSKERILIFYEEVDYLVILEDRGSYILPWTCYYIDYRHQKQKLLKEYDDYIKAKAAQQ
jgi:hypothetical protein